MSLQAQRSGEGIILAHSNLDGRESGRSAPPLGRFTPGKDMVPIVQEVGWATGTFRTGTEKPRPHRLRYSDLYKIL